MAARTSWRASHTAGGCWSSRSERRPFGQTARTMSRSTGSAAAAPEGDSSRSLAAFHSRLGASACGTAGSELGQLGGRCHDSLHVRAEVDDEGDSRFDTLYCAETIVFSSWTISSTEKVSGRRLGIAKVEGTGCEMALADRAVLAHYSSMRPRCGACLYHLPDCLIRACFWQVPGTLSAESGRPSHPLTGSRLAAYKRKGSQMVA